MSDNLTSPENLARIEKLHERANSYPNTVHHGYTRVDVDPDDEAFYTAAHEAFPALVAEIRRLGERDTERVNDSCIEDSDVHRLRKRVAELEKAAPTIPHPGGKLLKVVAHYEDGSTQTINGDVAQAALSGAKGGEEEPNGD